MKTTYIIIISLCSALLFFSSCNENNELVAPEISGVTFYSNPSDDTLIEGAFPETLILIKGKNLSTTKMIQFNGYNALVRTPYVTDNFIVVSVPSGAPNAATVADGETVANQILVQTNGGEATYPFVIRVPNPKINRVKNEFAAPNSINVIYGNYLYKVSKVIIPNGTESGIVVTGDKIIKNTANEVHFVMPQGAQKGAIIVENVIGNDTSKFEILDKTYMLLDFDAVEPTGYKDHGVIKTEDGNKFWYCAGRRSGFAWRNNIMTRPQFQGKDFSKGYLKFEFRSEKPLKDPTNSYWIKLQLTTSDIGFDNPTYQYGGFPNGKWQPYLMDEYSETGFHEPEWRTIIIPIKDHFPGMTTINGFGRILWESLGEPTTLEPLGWSIDNVRFSFYPDTEE